MASGDEKASDDFENTERQSEQRKNVHFSTIQSKGKRDERDSILTDSDSDFSDSEYFCQVCSKSFSGFIPFRQHEKGKSHAKALHKKKKIKQLKKIAESENLKAEDDEELSSFMQESFASCKACKKEFGGPESYAMHLSSKVHKLKVHQHNILEQVRENGKINVEKLKELYKDKYLEESPAEKTLSDDENEDSKFKCEDCNKVFTGIIPYTQHIMSKVHAKTIQQNKLLESISAEDLQHSSGKDVSTLAVEDDILVCKMCSMSFSGPDSALLHLKSRGHSKNIQKTVRKRERKAALAAAAARKYSAGSVSNFHDEPDEKLEAHTKPASESEPAGKSSSSSSSESSDDGAPQGFEAKTTFYRSSNESDDVEETASKIMSEKIVGQNNPVLDNANRSSFKSSAAGSTRDDLPEGSNDKIVDDASITSSERKYLFSSNKYNSYKKAINSLKEDD